MSVNIKSKYDELYINGDWVPSESNEKIDVINPATAELCASVPKATESEVASAILSASSAFDTWSKTTPEYRSGLILSIADKMESRLEELAHAITMTMGCPIEISRTVQVSDAIQTLRSYAHLAFEVANSKSIDGAIIQHEPIGVCVLINPWNYPLAQLVGKVGPALAAGCTMVVKPAEQTPLQDFILAEIFDEVGVPAGVFNLVSGYGPEIGPLLCQHEKVDMVSFTGSTRAGIKVSEAATTSIKRVCLELGGKSPFIITEDADIELAVQWGVEDVMINSGQTCNSHTRMLIPERHYEEALALAQRFAKEQTVGNPFDPDVTMGPLSSIKQKEIVLSYVEKGVSEGARLITEEQWALEGLDKGAYVQPIIFADVTNEMTIAQEEIFGPVICMIPYKTLEEAISIANDTVYGLSAAVYAKDRAEALKIASKLRAGQCFIQGAYFNASAPFGGYKQSGNGREGGRDGVFEYLETKAIIG